MRKVNVNSVMDSSRLNRFVLSVFFITFLVVVADGYDMGIYGIALPLLMPDLKLTPAQTGLLASTQMWGMMAGSVFFGMWSDKVGRKLALAVGLFVYATFTGLCAFAPDANTFAVLRFISGAGISSVSPVTIALVSEYSPKRHRSMLTSTNNAGVVLGMVLCPIVGLILLPALDNNWHALFAVALVPLVLLPFVLFGLPESMSLYLKRGQPEKVREVLTKANPDFVPTPDDVYEVSVANRAKASVGSLFQNGFARVTIPLWVMFFVNLYISFAITAWLPQVLTMMGYKLTNALLFTLVYSGAGLIAAPIVGVISDRVGGPKRVLPVAYIVIAILLNVFTIKMDPTLLYVVLFIAGSMSWTQIQLYALCAQSYPISMRGTALGWGGMITRLGQGGAPIAIGVLLGTGLPLNVIYGHVSIFALVGLVAVLATPRIRDFSVESLTPTAGATPEPNKA